MFSEDDGDRSDPRRLLVFQHAGRKQLSRKPFSVVSVDEFSRQVFSYITPERRYTYQRSVGPE
jgi:hypothetical protein